MRHDYRCVACGFVEERSVEASKLDKVPELCRCGEEMYREFPAQTKNYKAGTYSTHFMEFRPYYDEALDADIHGFREKKQILTAMGLQESGDPVGGARNLETSPHANVLDRQPERGIPFAERQRQREKKDPLVGVVKGNSVEYVKFSDLPGPSRATDTAEKVIHRASTELSPE